MLLGLKPHSPSGGDATAVLFGCHLSEIVKELSNSTCKHKYTLENALLYKACQVFFQDEGLHPTCDLFVVFL